MLVRFKMAQPESFTTLFLEGQPGRHHGTLFMLPNSDISSLTCILETILKMTDLSFVQRVTRASLENSFHLIGLLCKTHIFRPTFRVLLANGLLALKAESLLQLLIFSFTEPY